MQAKKHLRTALIILACAVGVWLLAVFALPLLLPFLIGLAIAALVEKPLELFLSRTKLPRAPGAFLFVLIFYALLITAVYFLCRIVCGEATRFLRELPELISSLAIPFGTLQKKLYELADRLPDGVGAAAREFVQSFFKNGSLIGSRIYDWLFSAASKVLGMLPDIVLFLITTVIASFMSSAELPVLREYIRAHTPARWQQRLAAVRDRLRATLGGYVRAQFKLMGVTFLILTAGFLILCISYPLLFGLLLAIVDALPVFGTGTVLIPWSILMFLRGNVRCGVGLLILYGCASLTRQALEPRMVGRHIGLHPLLTLIALYTGFRCAGIVGMVLFPVAAIFLKQIFSQNPQTGQPG